MLRMQLAETKLCDGITRRDWLQVGTLSALGATLAGTPVVRAHVPPASATGGAFGKAKACILFGLIGGPSQYESWDPKPAAPAEIRGIYQPTASATPGLHVCELMPRTAKLTEKLCVLRAVSTGDNAHSSSGYYMMTGEPHKPVNMENARPSVLNSMPSLAACARLLRSDKGLPSSIVVPENIWNDGNIPWPGQDGGVLGRRADPWFVHCDPASKEFGIAGLALPDDVPTLRFDERRSLLSQFNGQLDQLERAGTLQTSQLHRQQAYDLLRAGSSRKAFDLDHEPVSLRERYGMSRFAQSTLLARRLVEAGVSFVQINWTRIANQLNQGGWDTHAKHNEAVKNLLMPIMDRAYSALLEDLDARGLLDTTLVVWFGEFGRTPKFNGNGGRDHWGHVFSLALAGGGVKGGVVYGASDKQGAYPKDGRVLPQDLAATIYHCLGYAPDTELLDPLKRPIPISRGKVLHSCLV